MRKLIFAIVATVALFFTACESDDENNNENKTTFSTEDIIGKWTSGSKYIEFTEDGGTQYDGDESQDITWEVTEFPIYDLNLLTGVLTTETVSGIIVTDEYGFFNELQFKLEKDTIKILYDNDNSFTYKKEVENNIEGDEDENEEDGITFSTEEIVGKWMSGSKYIEFTENGGVEYDGDETYDITWEVTEFTLSNFDPMTGASTEETVSGIKVTDKDGYYTELQFKITDDNVKTLYDNDNSFTYKK